MQTKKQTNWRLMKNWSWSQMSGFEGNDKIVIARKPIIIIVQQRTGTIETKTIQYKEKEILLKL